MGKGCCLSMVSTTSCAKSTAPSPPFRKASLTAKPTSKSSQFLRTMSISSSVSKSKRFSVTMTGCPKPCMLRICRFRFFSPSVSPLAFGSLMLSRLTPPCIFSPCVVATMTTRRGCKPALRHLMSKNFSAPRSAPNPASVTT